MGYLFDDEDDEVQAARNQAATGNRNAAMIMGLAQMFQGKTDPSVLSGIRADNADHVRSAEDRYKLKRSNELVRQKLMDEKAAREAKAKADEASAATALSEKQKDRDAALTRTELMAKATEGRHNDSLDLRRLVLQNQMGQQKVANDRHAEEQAAKRDDKLNSQTTGIAKDLSGFQGKQNSIKALEDTLGFALEDYDPETEKAYVKDPKTGKKMVKTQDLPGVSIPGIGRVSAYSSGARQIDSAMAEIINAKIKDSAGTAVSNSEMERIKQEYAAGKYNTEAEMLKALARYKRALADEMANREKGYDPEALATYQSRGGRTSSPVGASPSFKQGGAGTAVATPETVNIQAPDGSVRAVPKASVQKYLDKGGKVVP